MNDDVKKALDDAEDALGKLRMALDTQSKAAPDSGGSGNGEPPRPPKP